MTANAGSLADLQRAFQDYLLAFELTSVLLLVAIAGAVVLARGRTVSAR